MTLSGGGGTSPTRGTGKLYLSFLFFFFFFFFFFRAFPFAFWGFQVWGWIEASGSLPSHSNARSEPRLQPTPQLIALPDP